jgi:hypothetical protein
MSLDEKAALAKKAGITYGQLQQLTDGCKSKEEINKAVDDYMREAFLKRARRIADGVRVYP